MASFQQLWFGVASSLPRLFAALLLFIIGWWVAVALGKLVSKVVKAFKIDHIVKTVGFEEVLTKAGFRLDVGAFFGALVKWFLIIVSLVAAMDIVGLGQVNNLLVGIVNYLPNVFVASVILVVATYVAEIVKKLVVGSAKAVDAPSAHLLGGVAKWAVWMFAILASLFQLGIVGVFAQTLFTGVVAMLTIAGGLAFGLGGRDAAARYLDQLKKDISK